MDEPAEAWRQYSGRLATTHPLTAYGGVRLTRPALENLVEAVNAGRVPMLGQHDRARHIRTRAVVAFVEELPDGEFAAAIRGEVHVDDWADLGEVRAFSIAFGVDLDPGLWPLADDPRVTVAADAAWFEAEAIGAAAASLARLGHVKAQEQFQFAAAPTAKIIIQVALTALQAIGLNVAANILWDGVKTLWHRRRTPPGGSDSEPTTIEFHVTDGTHRVDAVITTSEESIARAAIAALSQALPELVTQPSTGERWPVVVWRPDADGLHGHWVPPN